jgi:hypothetical protein
VFKEGDRVRLSKVGRKHYKDTPYNPHNEIGTVEENNDRFGFGSKERMPYDVRWPSGIGNIYREVDLELAHPSISLEQMLKECLG